jgi:hypothetical protein
MMRRDSVSLRPRPRASGLLAAVLGSLLATMLGCSSRPDQGRAQIAEENDRDRYPVRTVGDVSTFSNADPLPVSGVGLVEGLDGTGGPAPASGYRKMLESDLLKQRVPKIKELLNSTDCTMVMVSGLIPPGARRGDTFDIEVTLPSGSRATSLRGGVLRRCVLYNYDFARNLSPAYANSNAALKGHAIAGAAGPLLVGFGGDEKARTKQAHIWGGGTVRVERPFHLVLNSNQQYARVANNVIGRINAAFQGTLPGGVGTETAAFRNSSTILLAVPPQYKYHPRHFLRVVRMIPLEDLPLKEGQKRLPYRAQLQQDLLDSSRTVVATLRLEALGAESKATLRLGLESKNPLVRFCAAESLTYLGSTSGAEELARVVKQQPYVRAYALAALASLDESVCHDQLGDLLASETDDETRYGAFRALRSLDPHDEAVRGMLLGESFWLHRVAPKTKPLIHIAMSKRPEVVLFGDRQQLVPPFSLQTGEFAVTAGRPEDVRCTISHFPLNSEGGSRTRCSLDLAEVLKVLAEQGASYPEVVELIRQADQCRSLSCRVRQDALPQVVSAEQLALAGRRLAGHKQPGEQSADAVELIKPDKELGETPALYQAAGGRRSATLDSDARALQPKQEGANAPRTAERR